MKTCDKVGKQFIGYNLKNCYTQFLYIQEALFQILDNK
jgi:hypothetical protein